MQALTIVELLSWPVLNPNSGATSDSPRPPPNSRFTACALNSAVNRRRMRPPGSRARTPGRRFTKPAQSVHTAFRLRPVAAVALGG
jgi:hypothetical protein